jgi:hypothetical protein
MKKQKHYTEAELIDLFGLNKMSKYTLLEKWLDTNLTTLTEYEQIIFQNLITQLDINVDTWNEEELKMNFIASLLNDFVAYNKSTLYRTYFEREISAVVAGYMMKTKTDFMIAKGILDLIKKPFFCFHEYKRSKKNADDPIAQVLESMLIAQEINKNDKPIYGVYIIGRYWHFMVMQGREYAISQPYIATKKEELLQIIAILRHFKIILERDLLD